MVAVYRMVNGDALAAVAAAAAVVVRKPYNFLFKVYLL